MKLHARNLGRMAATAAVALAVAIPSLFSATPAYAWKSPTYFDRGKVIARAKTWVDRAIPYSQTGWYKGYRTDCSGFISMAWGLDSSFVTWSLPEVAKPIRKEELKAGDIILNTQNHVVMFVKWANKQHTAYVVWEEAGTPHKAIQRVVRYPYDTVTASSYTPWRYTGGHSLDAPGQALPGPLVRTYAGNGQYLAPSAARYTNDKTLRIARDRAAKMAAAAKIRAQQAAQQAAETKAKAAAAEAAESTKAKQAEARPAAPAPAQQTPKATQPAVQAPAAQAAAAPAPAKPTVDNRPPALKLLQLIIGLLTR